MTSTTNSHHLQSNMSSLSATSGEAEDLLVFVRNDAEGGSLCHKIDEELTLSRAQTLHHNGEAYLYASPPESAATDLIYAQTAIQSHSDKQICVTPQTKNIYAPQTEFANLVPSGTHYCSKISIAGAYETFGGSKDDIINISTDIDSHQQDKRECEEEENREDKNYKYTGLGKTTEAERQTDRVHATRASKYHSYLYDGAPAGRNIMDMTAATEAQHISQSAVVPHNHGAFSVPVGGLSNLDIDASAKARNKFIPSLPVTYLGIDDTLSILKPQNEEKGGTHSYATNNPDTLEIDEKPAQKAQSSKCPSNEYLFEQMSFDELLVVIQLPSQSKSTAKAIAASAALHLDDISSNLLTTAIIALLTCSHEWTQIAAAKFLADSIQTGDTWRLVATASLSAAKSILEISKNTSRAKSIRNLINRSISACPALTSGAVLEFCKQHALPPHISNLLGEWALKFTSTSEAPVWHDVLSILSIPDKFHIKEYGPTCVTVELRGKTALGNPKSQLLWNVNGFSSRWRSIDTPLEMESLSSNKSKSLAKKRRYQRNFLKDDFKGIVRKIKFPDLIIVIEAKLSLKKMIALPGFIQWCETNRYRYLSLSCSSDTSKGGAGYAGVLTLCKFSPLATSFDLHNTPSDEARIITHEFESFIHVSIYSPCTGYDAVKMQARVKFDCALSEHIAHFRTETNKPIICAGDLNINPRRVDWHEKAFASMSTLRAASGSNHHPGCSPSELKGYDQILRKSNLTNAWEYLYPYSSQGMTWHPPTDPQGLLGWGQRLDHFLVTAEFLSSSSK